MTRQIQKYTGLLLTIAVLGGCQRNAPNQQSPNVSPTPTVTPTSGQQLETPPPTPDQVQIPQDWTRFYDGVIGVRLAYPTDWFVSPASSDQGEFAVYSFNPTTTPDKGGISSDQLKVAIVSFSDENERSLTIDDDSIISQQRISVDDYAATLYELSGQAGTSRSVEININTTDTYFISAYPRNSELINIFDDILEYIDLNAPQPVTISGITPGMEINSPLSVSGTIPGNWMFEAQTTMELRTAGSEIITSTTIDTQADWQTTEQIPFSGQLTFQSPDAILGYIYIQKSNPSGIPNNQETFSWPIRFE